MQLQLYVSACVRACVRACVCLHSDIEHFSSKGIVIVGGNCNARTACKPDFVLNDRYIPELDEEDYQADCNLPRFSLDKGSNSHGNRLLHMS